MKLDSILLWAAVLHGVLAVGCALGFLLEGPRILGDHQMVKPLKFALSLAIFLGTMAYVAPMLSVSSSSRHLLAWLLAVTMVVEMAVISTQALRGTTSHYNEASTFDRAAWRMMLVAVLAATITMAAIAVVATIRPLRGSDGRELSELSALAWRAGLWGFQLAAISGFAMGGRGQHTVGAADGGPGLPGVGWSILHGDLRISHFLALHALQLLPLFAVSLRLAPISESAQRTTLWAAIVAQALVVGWTLLRAFFGRTPW